MTMTVPLGVRVYRPFQAVDQLVTKYVDDVSYRSVIPGGYASATVVYRFPNAGYAPDSVIATGTAAGDSLTPDYIVVPDSQAVPVTIGVSRLWVYTDSTLASIRFNGVRLRVTNKISSGGFTNIFFDKPVGITNTGNVFVLSVGGRMLNNDPTYSKITALNNRVMIFDKRSAETVWEGRIEEAARGNDEQNVWALNCLGGMVAASDVERPMWYLDSKIDNWVTSAYLYAHTTEGQDMDSELFSDNSGMRARATIRPSSNWFMGLLEQNPLFRNTLAKDMLTEIGAFRVKIFGWDSINPSAAGGNAQGRLRADIYLEDPAENRTLMGQKYFNATSTAFEMDIADALWTQDDISTMSLEFHVEDNQRSSAAALNVGVTFYTMAIQVLRKNRYRAKLLSGADYLASYLHVPQVVEDVIGRFLAGGWDLSSDNAPWPGQVRAQDAYVDSTSFRQIWQLVYDDGTSAEDILNHMMQLEPNAYWAIWETRLSNHSYGFSEWTGNTYWMNQYRFEWLRWPTSWGYLIRNYDDFSEQPNGEEIINDVYYGFQKRVPGTDVFARANTYWWDTTKSPDLIRGGFTRSKHVVDDSFTGEGTQSAQQVAAQYIDDHQKVSNSGSVTVSKPIFLLETGDGPRGAVRMIDPWAVKPGRLVRVAPYMSEVGSIEEHPVNNLLYDNLNRSTSSGWGTSVTGQVWTIRNGTATEFSTTGSLGRIALGTNGARDMITAGNFLDFDITFRTRIPAFPTGGFSGSGLMWRYIDVNNHYLAHVRYDVGGTVTVELDKRQAGTYTVLAISDSSLLSTTNTINVRVFCVGDTMAVKVWYDTVLEPNTWQAIATDTTFPLPGPIGAYANTSAANTNAKPLNIDFDEIRVLDMKQPRNVDGAVWKAVTAEYSSADNKCKIGLDQLENWSLTTQVVR